jgi:hypothetical protein
MPDAYALLLRLTSLAAYIRVLGRGDSTLRQVNQGVGVVCCGLEGDCTLDTWYLGRQD